MASQVIPLPAARFSQTASNAVWSWLSDRPRIDAALVDAGQVRYLAQIGIRRDGFCFLSLDDAATGSDESNWDLTDAFETRGRVELTTPLGNLIVLLGASDRSDQYFWRPSNRDEVTALFNAFAGSGAAVAGSLTLRDRPRDLVDMAAADRVAAYAVVSRLVSPPPAPAPDAGPCGTRKPRQGQIGSHRIEDPVTRRTVEQLHREFNSRLKAVEVVSRGETFDAVGMQTGPAFDVSKQERVGGGSRWQLGFRESIEAGIGTGSFHLNAEGGPSQEITIATDAVLRDIENLELGTPFNLLVALQEHTLELDPDRFVGPTLTFTGDGCAISFLAFPTKIAAMGSAWVTTSE